MRSLVSELIRPPSASATPSQATHSQPPLRVTIDSPPLLVRTTGDLHRPSPLSMLNLSTETTGDHPSPPLLQRTGNLLTTTSVRANTWLYQGIQSNRIEWVRAALEDPTLDPNTFFKENPPLHLSIFLGRDEIFELLLNDLRIGGKINLRDRNGNTALISAFKFERHEYAGPLLDAGADVNLLNGQGEAALLLARELAEKNVKGSTEALQLLLNAGADLKFAWRTTDEHEPVAHHINSLLLSYAIVRGDVTAQEKIETRTSHQFFPECYLRNYFEVDALGQERLRNDLFKKLSTPERWRSLVLILFPPFMNFYSFSQFERVIKHHQTDLSAFATILEQLQLRVPDTLDSDFLSNSLINLHAAWRLSDLYQNHSSHYVKDFPYPYDLNRQHLNEQYLQKHFETMVHLIGPDSPDETYETLDRLLTMVVELEQIHADALDGQRADITMRMVFLARSIAALIEQSSYLEAEGYYYDPLAITARLAGLSGQPGPVNPERWFDDPFWLTRKDLALSTLPKSGENVRTFIESQRKKFSEQMRAASVSSQDKAWFPYIPEQAQIMIEDEPKLDPME
ncbi:hypothetical protein QS308_14025 [Paraburkholderia bonniea]|nr:ankyrin repeat domain-containing protein [Paraburkholderia bonniea]WJF95209.1 hypothetical protein QS308_14025 [Paraburkholderia bonniea]